MAFTIEVEKKGKDEEFGFEDLYKEAEVFHEECYGGETDWEIVRHSLKDWRFTCQRCRVEVGMFQERLEVIKTAIDGQKRILYEDADGKPVVSVIQKN